MPTIIKINDNYIVHSTNINKNLENDITLTLTDNDILLDKYADELDLQRYIAGYGVNKNINLHDDDIFNVRLPFTITNNIYVGDKEFRIRLDDIPAIHLLSEIISTYIKIKLNIPIEDINLSVTKLSTIRARRMSEIGDMLMSDAKNITLYSFYFIEN